ncbi:MAG: class IV lanthionine synthetase LanL [Pseudonocardiaceae bacterium]
MADFSFSIFTQESRVNTDGYGLAKVLESTLLALGEMDRWEVSSSGFWCGVTLQGQVRRSQGWKLHLSATVLSAEMVLARSLPVLLKSSSSFKFASTLDRVAQLNARNTPRGHSGKFITIYPESDGEAVRLAEALHEATAGLAGPRVLSDRPYLPGSLVHYRYGAFVEERRLSNDGLYSWVIFDPDGNPVEDRRGGTFRPPPWVLCPFPIPEDSGPDGDSPQENDSANNKGNGQGLLIGDRFLVREAIRHTNKGGVYRAVDTESGADAVIKEARPHVAVDDTGKDVRDMLHAEARALEKVQSVGVAPRLLKLFEQSQHLFLAEESVPGVPLRKWVLDRIRTGGWRRHVPGALEMAVRVAELMDVAHQAGLILRDFNPNNIMVRPDGELRLIDLELAVVVGGPDEITVTGGTPSFSAPEQMKGAPPAVEADYYGLGSTICFVVTGAAPVLLEDFPNTRPSRDRVTDWLTVRAERINLPADIQTLILGLMDDEPERRCTTTAARNMLIAARQQPRSPGNGLACGNSGSNDGRLDDDQWQEAVDGSVGYLLRTMNPAHDEQLWPATCYHAALDQCAVQVGAAGIVGVLTRYFELTGDQRLPEAITTAGRWIAQRAAVGARRFSSLYFGEAGIAWSLYEAGRAVGDDQLVEQSLALADTISGSAGNPDLTHGTAGIGLTFLHLWLRTGNENFAERAGKAADELVVSVSEEPTGISWGAPEEFDSRFAGRRFLGFSHGMAGVGHFLLAMGLATGRSDCLELAERTGETLLAHAVMERGAAMWGAGPGDETTAPYWCHGSSGIGSFLTRLHRATGDDRYGKMADLSTRAVMENLWRIVLGQCHGLAGNGDFLLDMAQTAHIMQTADGQTYEAMAHQLARVIFASRTYRDGLVVFPDEQGELSASWAHGVSGILAFLLRLRHGSPRQWMVDSLLTASRH